MTTPQLRVEKRTPGYWRATFDHPPINLIDPQTIGELGALVSQIESDPEVRVVVFDSADEDFFLAHYDVLVDKAVGAVPGGGPMARLARLVGRGRALEIIAGADDFPGELAAQYGYINRAVPDRELDGFVESFARVARAVSAGLQKRGEVELNLGRYTGESVDSFP